MKEELCEKVVEVRGKSDRGLMVVMALEEEVVRIMCVWSAKWQRVTKNVEWIKVKDEGKISWLSLKLCTFLSWIVVT